MEHRSNNRCSGHTTTSPRATPKPAATRSTHTSLTRLVRRTARQRSRSPPFRPIHRSGTRQLAPSSPSLRADRGPVRSRLSATRRAPYPWSGTRPRHDDDDSHCRFAQHQTLGAQTVPSRPAIAPRPTDAGAEPRDDGLRVASRLPPAKRLGTFKDRVWRADLVPLRRPSSSREPTRSVRRLCAAGGHRADSRRTSARSVEHDQIRPRSVAGDRDPQRSRTSCDRPRRPARLARRVPRLPVHPYRGCVRRGRRRRRRARRPGARKRAPWRHTRGVPSGYRAAAVGASSLKTEFPG